MCPPGVMKPLVAVLLSVTPALRSNHPLRTQIKISSAKAARTATSPTVPPAIAPALLGLDGGLLVVGAGVLVGVVTSIVVCNTDWPAELTVCMTVKLSA